MWAIGPFALAIFALTHGVGPAIHELMQDVDSAQAWLLQYGVPASAAWFFAINTLLCACGFPRLWSGAFAGALFGGVLGLVLSLPSSVAGACLTFAFARGAGSRRLLEAADSKWGRRIDRVLPGGMWQAVLVRQLPVPGIAATLMLAFSSISPVRFVISSAIGFVPGAAAASFAGGVVTARSASAIAGALAAIAVSLLTVSILQHGQTTDSPRGVTDE